MIRKQNGVKKALFELNKQKNSIECNLNERNSLFLQDNKVNRTNRCGYL